MCQWSCEAAAAETFWPETILAANEGKGGFHNLNFVLPQRQNVKNVWNLKMCKTQNVFWKNSDIFLKESIPSEKSQKQTSQIWWDCARISP